MTPTDLIGPCEERPFPRSRIPTLDTLAWGRRRHHVPVLLEVDVSAARAAIRRQKAATGEGVSFTAWIIHCLARAVSEHPHVHALRRGRSRLVVFRDVDVAVVVERAAQGGRAGETLPMPYVVRRADAKTLTEVHAEIRAAQHAPVAAGEVQVDSARAAWATRLFTRLPRTLRDLIVWRPLLGSPFRVKQRMGTVCVTAIGMMGGAGMSWGIPTGIHPLELAVGGIARRPALVEGRLAEREYLGLTVLFDHAVTDGAPVARFLARLQELLGEGYGLDAAPGAPAEVADSGRGIPPPRPRC